MGGMSYVTALKNSVEEHTITVKEKWIKYHENDAKYLISDTDNTVYSIEDSFWFWTWDASDRYARIEIGKAYTIKTIGWRIHILSWYKNIIELKQI